MIFIIFPLLITSQRIQKKQWETFEYTLPEVSQGQDILITLTKDRYSEPALLVGRSIRPPVYSKDSDYWKISAFFSDVQGFSRKLSSLFLRIPYLTANITQKFNLGVYKFSTQDLAYSITSSYVASNKCIKDCDIEGICKEGNCKCEKFMQIGYDCSIYGDTIMVDKELNIELNSNEWEFYRVANSENNKNLKLSLSCENSPGMRVFQVATEVSYLLPSMLDYAEQYSLFKKNQEMTKNLERPTKSYWLWSFYCDSSKPCKAKIKIFEKKSYSANFLWIIIASVISLGVFCICTPIVLKLVFALKRRRLKKIADLETELKKKAFTSRFPQFKFSSSAGESCSICLEDLKAGDSVHRLACEHLFHAVCILEWYMSKPFCPLCKRDIMGQTTVENLS